MTAVSLADGRVRAGELAMPLLSGEVHYWRLDPGQWRLILQRVKELRLGMVATYVCWDFHEVERGRFDFRGETDPRRNLLGYLDLLAEEDLWVILRPGPYIYSEWRNGGVPDYAARYHRLHPTFQALAEPYMQAVVEAVRPHLATHGGRVVLFQADNEIDSWPHWYTEPLGLGRENGPFQTFLRERYKDVSALNAAWGAEYQSFDEARATSAMRTDEPDRLRRYLDYARFTHWYVNQVARWTVETYRGLGVDVPIYLNAYSGVATQLWADLEQIGDLAGPDIYPSHEFSHRANEQRNFLEAVRYTRTYSRVPHIPEFEAGVWHGWHYDVGALGANHYRLVCLSALLAGAVGWNWYMLVNRDNWYMSPINEWGRTRPELYSTMRQIVALFESLDPPSLAKLTETALTHDQLQRATVRPGQEMLQAFYQADIDYEFFDVNRGAVNKPLLFYAGGPWLSEAAQSRLLKYVEAGGHLVCLGTFPRYDDQLRPHNALGIAEPEGILGLPEPLRLRVALGDSAWTVESAYAFNYATVPGEPITAERLPGNRLTAEELTVHNGLQAGRSYLVGYTQTRGQGRLTVIGLAPSPELIAGLHRDLNVRVYARSRTPNVLTALFQRDTDFYLIAVNNGDEAKAAEIELAAEALPGARFAVHDLLTGARSSIDLAESPHVVANLARKDGTVLRLSSTRD